jgi:hypothetical protein
MNAGTVPSLVSKILAVALGFGIPLMLWGGPSAEDRELQERQIALKSLPEETQLQMRQLTPEFANMTDERKRAVLETHEAVQRDAALRSRLDSFAAWFSEQDSTDRSQMLSELQNRKLTAADISQRISSEQAARGEIVIHFAARIRRRPEWPLRMMLNEGGAKMLSLPELHLPITTYLEILNDVFPEQDMTATEKDELNRCQKPEERALVRTFQEFDSKLFDSFRRMFEAFSRAGRGGSDRGQPPATAEFREMVDSFRSSLRSHIQNKKWQEYLRGDDEIREKGALMLAFLLTGTSALIEKLPEPVISDDQLITAYTEMTDSDLRRRVMVEGPERAREQLTAWSLKQHPEKSGTNAQLWLKATAFRDRFSPVAGQFPGRNGPRTAGGRERRGPGDRTGDRERERSRPDEQNGPDEGPRFRWENGPIGPPEGREDRPERRRDPPKGPEPPG